MSEPTDGGDVVSAVGRVLGTEDSTPLSFHVALNEDAYLQLGCPIYPGQGPPSRIGVT